MDSLLSRSTAVGAPSIQERIRMSIENDIMSGVRAPGSPIDEKALALAYHASRTPVREALLLLAGQGLVTILPRAGIFVRAPTALELVAHLEALGELEAVLAQFAARRATLEARERLRAALVQTTRCEEDADRNGYATANAALHELIYEASHNPVLVDQVRRVRRVLASYRQRGFDQPGRLTSSNLEHRRIVEAICAGDGVLAAQAMREHISIGGEALMALVHASDPGSR